MKRITDKNEMVKFLGALGTGCQFVSLRTETVVQMRTTDNPFVGTVKVTKRVGLINVDFVSSVRRRMADLLGIPFVETVYVPGETWFRHVQRPLMVHKTDERRFYCQFFPLKSEGTRYFLKGKELTKDEVEQMRGFVIQKTRDDRKPLVIVLAIDSIREMRARTVTILNQTVNRIAQRLSEQTPAQKRVPLDISKK
jgi:hypothetical protein